MAFGRLHEEAAGDGKLLALSDAAFRMWACGLIYCQKNLTDGFIPEHAIAAFGVRGFDGAEFYRVHFAASLALPAKVHALLASVLRGLTTTPATVADELCRAQLPERAPVWERVAGGFKVHDYLDWNDSRAEILKARALSRDRMRRKRGELSREQNGEHAGEHVVGSTPEHPTEHTGEPVVRGSLSSDPKEPIHNGPPARHLGDGAAGIGGSPRAHLRHVWCDPATFARCVPEAVHSKLANMLAPKHGGDRAKASAALLAWYPTVVAAMPSDAPIGDEFKFWQRQFDAAFVAAVGTVAGVAQPGRTSAVPGVAETVAKYL